MTSETHEKTAKELFAPAEPITNTRDRLIATALDLFYEQGFHAIGVDRIIREVGVTKTTFYNHFESKDELILEAINMRDRWESKSFEQAVEHFSDGTPRGTMLAVFDALDQWFNDPDYAGCLFITACAEFPSRHDPVHLAAAGHYNRATAMFIELAGACGAKDPSALAQQLELLAEGAVVMRMIKHDNSTAKAARQMAEVLLDHAGCSG